MADPLRTVPTPGRAPPAAPITVPTGPAPLDALLPPVPGPLTTVPTVGFETPTVVADVPAERKKLYEALRTREIARGRSQGEASAEAYLQVYDQMGIPRPKGEEEQSWLGGVKAIYDATGRQTLGDLGRASFKTPPPLTPPTDLEKMGARLGEEVGIERQLAAEAGAELGLPTVEGWKTDPVATGLGMVTLGAIKRDETGRLKMGSTGFTRAGEVLRSVVPAMGVVEREGDDLVLAEGPALHGMRVLGTVLAAYPQEVVGRAYEAAGFTTAEDRGRPHESALQMGDITSGTFLYDVATAIERGEGTTQLGEAVIRTQGSDPKSLGGQALWYTHAAADVLLPWEGMVGGLARIPRAATRAGVAGSRMTGAAPRAARGAAEAVVSRTAAREAAAKAAASVIVPQLVSSMTLGMSESRVGKALTQRLTEATREDSGLGRWLRSDVVDIGASAAAEAEEMARQTGRTPALPPMILKRMERIQETLPETHPMAGRTLTEVTSVANTQPFPGVKLRGGLWKVTDEVKTAQSHWAELLREAYAGQAREILGEDKLVQITPQVLVTPREAERIAERVARELKGRGLDPVKLSRQVERRSAARPGEVRDDLSTLSKGARDAVTRHPKMRIQSGEKRAASPGGAYSVVVLDEKQSRSFNRLTRELFGGAEADKVSVGHNPQLPFDFSAAKNVEIPTSMLVAIQQALIAKEAGLSAHARHRLRVNGPITERLITALARHVELPPGMTPPVRPSPPVRLEFQGKKPGVREAASRYEREYQQTLAAQERQHKLDQEIYSRKAEEWKRTAAEATLRQYHYPWVNTGDPEVTAALTTLYDDIKTVGRDVLNDLTEMKRASEAEGHEFGLVPALQHLMGQAFTVPSERAMAVLSYGESGMATGHHLREVIQSWLVTSVTPPLDALPRSLMPEATRLSTLLQDIQQDIRVTGDTDLTEVSFGAWRKPLRPVGEQAARLHGYRIILANIESRLRVTPITDPLFAPLTREAEGIRRELAVWEQGVVVTRPEGLSYLEHLQDFDRKLLAYTDAIAAAEAEALANQVARERATRRRSGPAPSPPPPPHDYSKAFRDGPQGEMPWPEPRSPIPEEGPLQGREPLPDGGYLRPLQAGTDYDPALGYQPDLPLGYARWDWVGIPPGPRPPLPGPEQYGPIQWKPKRFHPLPLEKRFLAYWRRKELAERARPQRRPETPVGTVRRLMEERDAMIRAEEESTRRIISDLSAWSVRRAAVYREFTHRLARAYLPTVDPTHLQLDIEAQWSVWTHWLRNAGGEKPLPHMLTSMGAPVADDVEALYRLAVSYRSDEVVASHLPALTAAGIAIPDVPASQLMLSKLNDILSGRYYAEISNPPELGQRGIVEVWGTPGSKYHSFVMDVRAGKYERETRREVGRPLQGNEPAAARDLLHPETQRRMAREVLMHEPGGERLSRALRELQAESESLSKIGDAEEAGRLLRVAQDQVDREIALVGADINAKKYIIYNWRQQSRGSVPMTLTQALAELKARGDLHEEVHVITSGRPVARWNQGRMRAVEQGAIGNLTVNYVGATDYEQGSIRQWAAEQGGVHLSAAQIDALKHHVGPDVMIDAELPLAQLAYGYIERMGIGPRMGSMRRVRGLAKEVPTTPRGVSMGPGQPHLPATPNVWVPSGVADEIEKAVRRSGITVSDVMGTEVGERVRGTLNWVTRARKTGILTGLALPNTLYFAGNFLGALPTIALTQGVGTMLATMGAMFQHAPLVAAVVRRQSKWGLRHRGGVQTLVTPTAVHSVDDLADMAQRIETGVQHELASALMNDVRNLESGWLERTLGSESPIVRGLDRAGQAVATYHEVLKEVAQATDMMFRVGVMIDALKRGSSPEQAIKRGKEALYDYGSISPAERAWARKLVLLYSYQRLSMTTTLAQMWKHPERVGALARFSRLQHQAWAPDAYLEKDRDVAKMILWRASTAGRPEVDQKYIKSTWYSQGYAGLDAFLWMTKLWYAARYGEWRETASDLVGISTIPVQLATMALTENVPGVEGWPADSPSAAYVPREIAGYDNAWGGAVSDFLALDAEPTTDADRAYNPDSGSMYYFHATSRPSRVNGVDMPFSGLTAWYALKSFSPFSRLVGDTLPRSMRVVTEGDVGSLVGSQRRIPNAYDATEAKRREAMYRLRDLGTKAKRDK